MVVPLSNLLVPLNGIRFEDGSVEALMGDEGLGKGTLYITEDVIMWMKQGNEGFRINYKKMTLHAISRDPSVYQRPCLYVMVNGPLGEEGGGGGQEVGQGDGNEDDEDEDEPTEIRFVPEDEDRLEAMYKAVQDCTLLHPDPASDMSEESEGEEEEEGEFEGEEGQGYGVVGHGRILPGMMGGQEQQIGMLQQHFGDRLIFEHNVNNPSSNGNGHQPSPTQEDLREMFQDDEED